MDTTISEQRIARAIESIRLAVKSNNSKEQEAIKMLDLLAAISDTISEDLRKDENTRNGGMRTFSAGNDVSISIRTPVRDMTI